MGDCPAEWIRADGYDILVGHRATWYSGQVFPATVGRHGRPGTADPRRWHPKFDSGSASAGLAS
ncbi:hypothetical protein GA0070618_5757 [Micromonospora echinospora]|uniref:Uncharacterized protein n=1 Tax=Micromonospora echinospora TaxID=1877 RepID=A0A1C4ZTU8_MICEC|nr:hypothetical protein GA0070618_5757 [Micromonospora echinospora]